MIDRKFGMLTLFDHEPALSLSFVIHVALQHFSRILPIVPLLISVEAAP
jgi:hypothetical protein